MDLWLISKYNLRKKFKRQKRFEHKAYYIALLENKILMKQILFKKNDSIKVMFNIEELTQYKYIS